MPLIAPTAEMVGRDAELGLLDAALRRAAAGETASVLVSGEAGIGKTRLLREFRARAETSAAVFTGWCVDYGATPAPYAPLPAILRGVLAELGEETTAEAAGPARAALRLLLPELGPVDRAAVTPDGLREAIATLLEAAAARRPVVVLIEDLHWADDATLAMLSFLLRAVSGHGVLFVLTCRVDEVRRGGAVRSFLVEAERARLLDRIALGRLDPVAVRAMVEALSGPVDDAVFTRLLDRSEGVPFFVEELSCNALGPLPESLRDVLLARFDRLGDDAKRVVRIASASDAPVPHELLADLAALPDERLDEGIREAAAAAILAVRPDDSYGFRHALLREAVHDDLLPGERARLHRAYAEALEIRAAAPGACLESALAYHWHQAHDAPRALAASIGAMERSKASYAFSTAARFGELALELWDQVPDAAAAAGIDRVSLLRRLGSILRNAGDGERALAVVNLALDEVDPATSDRGVYVRLLRDKALYLQNLGRPGAAELLAEALAAMDGLDDDRLRASVLNLLAGRHMVAARIDEAIETADAAYRIAERLGDHSQMSIAANTRAASRVHRGDVEGGLEDYRLSWQRATDDSARLRYYVNYSDVLHHLGRHREAVRVAEEGIARARTLGVERTTGSILTQNVAEPLLQLGEVDRAEQLLARDLTFRTHRIFRVYTMATRMRVLAWRGRIAEARALLAEWRETMAAVAPFERQVEYSLLSTELAIHLGAGEAEEAAAVIRRFLAADGPLIGHASRLLLEAGWVVSAVRADGRMPDAAALAESVRTAWAALPPGLRPEGWSVVLTALLDGAPDVLRAALPVTDEDDMPAAFRVVVRLDLARRLIHDGERAEAASALSAAREIAAAIGNARLQQEADELALASGLSGEPAAPALAELTARESQVLDLLAEGLSNRQIGERLFISVRPSACTSRRSCASSA
ncbi:ATP-binding protein [Microbacterium sp. EF45047]|nr:AAA family ATPase [Microbacterium sp. EF45047]WCM55811.1 AAA family ATPase [Microbacterium sp. EF45047]